MFYDDDGGDYDYSYNYYWLIMIMIIIDWLWLLLIDDDDFYDRFRFAAVLINISYVTTVSNMHAYRQKCFWFACSGWLFNPVKCSGVG